MKGLILKNECYKTVSRSLTRLWLISYYVIVFAISKAKRCKPNYKIDKFQFSNIDKGLTQVIQKNIPSYNTTKRWQPYSIQMKNILFFHVPFLNWLFFFLGNTDIAPPVAFKHLLMKTVYMIIWKRDVYCTKTLSRKIK